MSRQHASSNSAVVSPVAIAGLSDDASGAFSAQKFPDDGHFELEQKTEIGHLFTCLDHLADD